MKNPDIIGRQSTGTSRFSLQLPIKSVHQFHTPDKKGHPNAAPPLPQVAAQKTSRVSQALKVPAVPCVSLLKEGRQKWKARPTVSTTAPFPASRFPCTDPD